jgi:hypothetical protein
MPKWFSLSLLIADRHPRQFIESLASEPRVRPLRDLAPRLGSVK